MQNGWKKKKEIKVEYKFIEGTSKEKQDAIWDRIFEVLLNDFGDKRGANDKHD